LVSYKRETQGKPFCHPQKYDTNAQPVLSFLRVLKLRSVCKLFYEEIFEKKRKNRFWKNMIWRDKNWRNRPYRIF